MAFWSGEKLARLLPSLIQGFNADSLDCASYKLRVGEQVFVTSDKFAGSAPADPLVSILGSAPNHTLRIRPGQFAFLLTEETVRVPSNAIALISMRTTYKFKGLINVSGFHVDPGWHGQLLFSVYNAGPAEVIVSKGQELFLIVFADLDRDSSQTYKGKSQYQSAIDTSLLQNMTEQVFSPLMLQRQMKDMQDQMGQIRTITYAVSSTAVIVLAIAGVFAAFAPATLGIVLARMMDGGGYEMRLKRDSTQTVESTPVVVQPSASASPVATTPAGSSAASGSRVPSKRD